MEFLLRTQYGKDRKPPYRVNSTRYEPQMVKILNFLLAWRFNHAIYNLMAVAESKHILKVEHRAMLPVISVTA